MPAGRSRTRPSLAASRPATRRGGIGRQCVAGAWLCVGLLAAACGKKGPPLPPLVRVPESITSISAQRVGGDVYVTLRIPAQNIDGSTPADVETVDLLALTADRSPSRATFLERATRVATLPVAPPVPAGEPPPATPPVGSVQGTDVTIRETPAGDALVPVVIAVESAPEPQAGPPGVTQAAPGVTGTPPGPQANVATTVAAPRRYYMAVGRGAGGRRSSPSGTMASVSWQPEPDSPADVAIANTPATLTVSWRAVAGATGYNIYRDTPTDPVATPEPASALGSRPVPLNAAPLEVRAYTEAVQFGRRICFRVRAVVLEAAGESIEGAASPPSCLLPRDTYPPAAPTDVSVVAVAGEILVSWAPNGEADLAGYVVLRGKPGDDTLLPITASPLTETRFVDRSVMPGVRYVYAVVAVDSAPTPNRSEPSGRDEATAR